MKKRWVSHDIRDAIVDFVNLWGGKTEIPASRLVFWIGIGSGKFHDWKGRFGKVNEHNAWIPRDHWLTDEEKERIRVFARSHSGEGYRQLTYMMLDADVVACSPASVYRVLKQSGLLAGSTAVPSKKGTGFVQPLKPHDHWHTDISYLNIAGTFYFLCAILDGASRFVIHWEIREKMEDSDVLVVAQRARELYPDARPRIISDNGPQFLSREFKAFIRISGMTHAKTSPYYPQSNGKIERWHKTLKGDCIRVLVPLSLEDARRVVGDYTDHYNTKRLHSAIGYVTPKDKLEGKDVEIHKERDRKLKEARLLRQIRRQEEKARPISPTAAVLSRPPIDFEAVKNAIGMEGVLLLLGFMANSSSGAQRRGPCPLHGSTSGTSRCFSAHLDKNAFQCFKCGRSGNALDLWAKATNQAPYDAAVDLCNRLNVPLPLLPRTGGLAVPGGEPVAAELPNHLS